MRALPPVPHLPAHTEPASLLNSHHPRPRRGGTQERRAGRGGVRRIHGETDCVPDIDVSGLDHRQSGEGVKGAGAGQYACYNSDFHNQKYFQGCADVAASDAGEKGDAEGYDHSEHDHGSEEKETDEPAVEADEPAVKSDESDSSASRSFAVAAVAVAILPMIYEM